MNNLYGKSIIQNSKFKIQNPELRTQNSKLKTQNSELRTQNSELRTQNSEIGQDLPIRFQIDWITRLVDSGNWLFIIQS